MTALTAYIIPTVQEQWQLQQLIYSPPCRNNDSFSSFASLCDWSLIPPPCMNNDSFNSLYDSNLIPQWQLQQRWQLICSPSCRGRSLPREQGNGVRSKLTAVLAQLYFRFKCRLCSWFFFIYPTCCSTCASSPAGMPCWSAFVFSTSTCSATDLFREEPVFHFRSAILSTVQFCYFNHLMTFNIAKNVLVFLSFLVCSKV